jgi:hypothetical protein
VDPAHVKGNAMWIVLAILIALWATERGIPLDLIGLLFLLWLFQFFKT